MTIKMNKKAQIRKKEEKLHLQVLYIENPKAAVKKETRTNKSIYLGLSI